MTMPAVVNLAAAFATIPEVYHPHLAGEVNDTHVKLVRLKGDFVWHQHEHEDEMFLVISGVLIVRFRDGDARIGPGEFIVVPRGVEHCPSAPDEVHVMLVEPGSTLNTGNVRSERTRDVIPRLAV